MGNGGEDRFAQLYRDHYARVVGLCRRYLGPHRDAEAVAQESFVRAWESWDRYASDREFWPWVATIARRLCINEVHACARRDNLRLRAARNLVVSRRMDSDDVERLVDSHGVRRVMRLLSPRHQRLLRLRDIEGWSYDEIAGFEGTSVEAVRGSLKRARAAFRRGFDEVVRGALGGFGLGRLRDTWAWRRSSRLLHAVDRGFALDVRTLGADCASLIVVAASLLGSSGGTVEQRPAVASSPDARAAAEAPAPPVPPNPGRAASASPRPSQGPAPVAALPAPAPAPVPPGAQDSLHGPQYEFTVSPAYEEDRTVFAHRTSEGCGLSDSTCGELLRSQDGGRTWTKLTATGYRGWPIMLPPAYPHDRRIFSASGGMLWMSEDDGASFAPLGVTTGLPAMTPRFSSGDPRLLLGSPVSESPFAFEYNVVTKETKQLSLPLPPASTAMRFAFEPAPGGRRVLVSGFEQVGLLRVPTLFSCDETRCERSVRSDGNQPFHVSWVGGRNPVALAYDTFSLYRSVDGIVFEKVTLPSDRYAVITNAVASGSTGRIWVSTFSQDFDDQAFHTSGDGGRTWERLVTDGLLTKVTALPDGTLLSVRSRVHGGGVYCSVDGGRTWARTCGGRSA